jgi:malate synthase
MEDAATAEISRSQIWQWLKFGARLEGGQKVTKAFFEKCLKQEMERVAGEVGPEAFRKGRFREAIDIFRKMSTSEHFETFLTLPAYRKIV